LKRATFSAKRRWCIQKFHFCGWSTWVSKQEIRLGGGIRSGRTGVNAMETVTKCSGNGSYRWQHNIIWRAWKNLIVFCDTVGNVGESDLWFLSIYRSRAETRKKIEKQSGAHRCRPVRLRNIRFTSPGSQGGWMNPNFNRWVNRSSGTEDELAMN
jgi:hypothetical protein